MLPTHLLLGLVAGMFAAGRGSWRIAAGAGLLVSAGFAIVVGVSEGSLATGLGGAALAMANYLCGATAGWVTIGRVLPRRPPPRSRQAERV